MALIAGPNGAVVEIPDDVAACLVADEDYTYAKPETAPKRAPRKAAPKTSE